jgi:hypothetical protein
MVVFRWHFTSQAIETPLVNGKLRFERFVHMLPSHGQYCPQFAPHLVAGDQRGRSCFAFLTLPRGGADSCSIRIRVDANALRRFPVVLSAIFSA